jgi:hypothetical protein
LISKRVTRGIAAAVAMFLFAAASEAPAQTVQPVAAGQVDAAAKPLGKVGQTIANVAAAVKSLDVDSASKPLGAAVSSAMPAVAATMAMATVSGGLLHAQPSIATEASWLYRAGWPLNALVDRYSAGAPLDAQAACLATADYFEARGESLEGQLAVAHVVMNRAASGKYPTSWCGVVKQPWQFSFVNPRTGYMPSVDQDSQSWRNALGVTRLAVANAVPSLPTDCLWYHADYVAPSWGKRLSKVQKIGAHIFYRA